MTWIERIEKAEKRGWFTKEDRQLAAGWVTCACGEQDRRIPGTIIKGPEDRKLNALGIAFYCDVDRNNFGSARLTLAEIEVRAGQILAEIMSR